MKRGTRKLDRTPPQISARSWWTVGVVAVLAVSPLFGIPSWTVSTAVLAAIMGIAAIGLNILIGYGGMVDLGGAIFLGASAYGAVLLSVHLSWPYVPSALLAIAASGVVAWLLGTVLARLPTFYFAVSTLGISVALQGVFLAFPGVTNGDSGIPVDRTLPLGFMTVSSPGAWYVFSLIVCLAAVILFKRLGSDWRARVMALMREDELAANVFGVEVAKMRRTLFCLGSLCAATAGVLLVRWQGIIVPEDSGLTQSVQMLGFAVVGGMGTTLGPLVGSALLVWLAAAVNTAGNLELLIDGGVFLVVVLFVGNGIVGAATAGFETLWRRGVRLNTSEVNPISTFGNTPPTEWGPAVSPEQVRAERTKTMVSGSSTADGLKLEGVVRTFGGVRAVDGVSLEARHGEITAIIGSNGAGKSTLMNIISGVEDFTEGVITLDGSALCSGNPTGRVELGIVRTFQTPRLVPGLTVLENVLLGVEGSWRLGFGSRHDRDRSASKQAERAIELTRLSPIAHRLAGELAGGQRKLVELARALARDATLILIDEPGAGLTVDEVGHLSELIADFRMRGSVTIVIDHNLDFIGEVADRVYVMDQGRIASGGELLQSGGGSGCPVGIEQRMR